MLDGIEDGAFADRAGFIGSPRTKVQMSSPKLRPSIVRITLSGCFDSRRAKSYLLPNALGS